MMNIVSLLGSPRKNGNSAALAQAFTDQAARLGTRVEVFKLNKLNFRGCQGCYKCKTGKERCAVADDLSQVLETLAAADLWVVASPIYFGQVSGQMKCCLDRWFSFLKPDYMTNPQPCRLAPGKQSVWVITQAGPENMYGEVFPHYTGFLKWYGFKQNHLLRATATGQAGATDLSPEKIAEAKELARKLMTA